MTEPKPHVRKSKGPASPGCIPRESELDDSPVGYVPCGECGGFRLLHIECSELRPKTDESEGKDGS